MTTYRLLGSATTDSNGVASISYTGVGAGELDIIASTSNPITQSSLVSETFELWDYVKYDYGTSANHNDIWTKLQSNARLNRGDEYTSMIEGSEVYAEIRTQITNQDCIIEMDIKNNGANSWVTSISQGNTVTNATQLTGFGLLSETFDQWTHLKIEIQGTTIKAYYNNETSARITRTGITRDTSKVLTFGFTTPQSVTEVDFKDFKVYPI